MPSKDVPCSFHYSWKLIKNFLNPFLKVHREDIKLCMMQFVRVLKENNNAHHHPL